MRVVFCLAALAMLSLPAAAQTPASRHDVHWVEVGRANYSRPDYGPSGPAPIYFAPGAYVAYAPLGPHFYEYPSGVRVWYGSVPAFAPVLASAPVAAQGAPIAAPRSPGPRVLAYASGVRVWYGAP